MSWFKHKPRTKTTQELHAQYSSPVSEQILKEIKLQVTGVKAKVLDTDKKKKI